MLAEIKNGHSKTASKKSKTLVTFFELHVLGIIAHFSEVFDDPHEMHPVTERRRYVGAIEEMINLAKGHVSIALPQVRLFIPILQTMALNFLRFELVYSQPWKMISYAIKHFRYGPLY
jgi:hypothetical protein